MACEKVSSDDDDNDDDDDDDDDDNTNAGFGCMEYKNKMRQTSQCRRSN